ncbi:MAG: hypothetical protein BroJett011_73620 [Chloroflexota bacterium]|nr:MAG: hypothetical protein BroJett011_73620 [Chloroflexota bacterium]
MNHKFLSNWVVANATFVTILGCTLAYSILETLTITSEMFLATIAVIGSIGVVQWLILQRVATASKSLVLVTIIGWVVSFTLVSCMSLSVADFLDMSSQWGNAGALVLIPFFILGIAAVGPIVFMISSKLWRDLQNQQKNE